MFTRMAPTTRDYGLTDRERAVLELMVRGMIMKEIATQLKLSVHTIDTHIRNIYDKLHVHTRSGAVAKAVKEKLV
jgi:DNA-binding CsgD family transcriptional regulator